MATHEGHLTPLLKRRNSTDCSVHTDPPTFNLSWTNSDVFYNFCSCPNKAGIIFGCHKILQNKSGFIATYLKTEIWRILYAVIQSLMLNVYVMLLLIRLLHTLWLRTHWDWILSRSCRPGRVFDEKEVRCRSSYRVLSIQGELPQRLGERITTDSGIISSSSRCSETSSTSGASLANRSLMTNSSN